MTAYEYALRTVTVATGREFELAHAVAPGTLLALCGTVAVPQPGSRWADSNPDVRCAACQAAIESSLSASETARARPVRVLSNWRRPGRRAQIAIAIGIVIVSAAIVILLSVGHGFRADPTSPAYENGYAYGHDLMSHSNDVTSSCTQGTVDDPASSDGKNFIAGCEAGYAARTP